MDFTKWSLEAIRDDGLLLSWMEERRVEWAPLLASRLKSFFDGMSFILITDDERDWFESYFLKNINKKDTRPVLPFLSLKSIYPNYKNISSRQDIELLEDMLNIAFPNGFIYFYIGKSSDNISQIPKSKDDSYMWLFDEQAQNSFYLSSSDEKLDIKLLSLFRLFNKSIDAVLFGKVTI